MYVLTLHFNDAGPFVVASEDDRELGARLGTIADETLRLAVSLGRGERRREHTLEPIRVGDSLRIRYDVVVAPPAETIDGLPECATRGPRPLADGTRLALAITEVPEAWNARFRGHCISYPTGGAFDLMVGTNRDHARVFVLAGNEAEQWSWQLPDLHSGDSIAFDVVETERVVAYPRMRPRDVTDDRLGLEILFRESTPGAEHDVSYELAFPSKESAFAAKSALEADGFTTDRIVGARPRFHVRATHRIVPTEASLADARERLRHAAPDAEYGGWHAEPA